MRRSWRKFALSLLAVLGLGIGSVSFAQTPTISKIGPLSEGPNRFGSREAFDPIILLGQTSAQDVPFDEETGIVHGYGPGHRYDVEITASVPDNDDSSGNIIRISDSPITTGAITAPASRPATSPIIYDQELEALFRVEEGIAPEPPASAETGDNEDWSEAQQDAEAARQDAAQDELSDPNDDTTLYDCNPQVTIAQFDIPWWVSEPDGFEYQELEWWESEDDGIEYYYEEEQGFNIFNLFPWVKLDLATPVCDLHSQLLALIERAQNDLDILNANNTPAGIASIALDGVSSTGNAIQQSIVAGLADRSKSRLASIDRSWSNTRLSVDCEADYCFQAWAEYDDRLVEAEAEIAREQARSASIRKLASAIDQAGVGLRALSSRLSSLVDDRPATEQARRPGIER